MIVKEHFSNEKLVLSIVDSDLIGKTIEEGDLILNLNSDFYKGEEVEEPVILKLFKKAYMVNAIGSNTRKFLENNNIKLEWKKIRSIPYTAFLLN